MGILYNSTPSQTGGFDVKRTGSAGYQNFSQGLPFYEGRSTIATIPEYQRNPGLLNQDVLMTIREGRANYMKLLYEFAQKNGVIEKPDVKFWYSIEVKPHDRIYLGRQSVSATSAANGYKQTWKLTEYTRPTQSYPTSTGNPKVVGQIARLEPGQFIMLMFSWIAPGRAGTNSYTESYSKPIPELAKVVSVNYENNTFVVERNWAGSQRTTPRDVSNSNFEVVANTATPSGNQIKEKDAFFVVLPKSMQEDEIDAKVRGYTQTWDYGIMQRHLKAWGGGTLSEIISRNIGRPSPMAKSKEQAIEDYYAEWEYISLWGEKSETWDSETGLWSGTTEGLLTSVPKSHHIGIVPMDYTKFYSEPKYAWGSFSIPVFTKLLSEKVYMGSEYLICLTGEPGMRMFMTMVNHMTQNVPDIKSEWNVKGKRFSIDGGLTVDFVLSDKMSLNGLRNKMILIDPSAFRIVNLQGYPVDIVEVQNENPLKKNGFIHGVHAFINLNPDAHWIFTLDNALAQTTGATYGDNVQGVPLED